MSFFKRPKTPLMIPFKSSLGQIIFKQSLDSIYNQNYFLWSENYNTQKYYYSCGKATMTIILNSLNIDPKIICQGVWRYYIEDMFNIGENNENGVSINEIYYELNKISEIKNTLFSSNLEFFDKIFYYSYLLSCINPNYLIIPNFSRTAFGQTGEGHFSPICLYNEVYKKILVMDTANFKYPFYWVDLDLFTRSIKTKNKKNYRGFILIKKKYYKDNSLFCKHSCDEDLFLNNLNIIKTNFLIFKKSTQKIINRNEIIENLNQDFYIWFTHFLFTIKEDNLMIEKKNYEKFNIYNYSKLLTNGFLEDDDINLLIDYIFFNKLTNFRKFNKKLIDDCFLNFLN